MYRKIIGLLLSMVMILASLQSAAFAETIVASGTPDGSGISWTLDDAGTLTVTGTL